MKPLKFAVFGTGFWANYQIPAWMELEGVELVALYNRTRSKAEVIARKFNVPRVYDDPAALLENETLDFIDIVTDVDTHAELTELAARKGVSVICQKPMAPRLEIARRMLDACTTAYVPFFVHENWRWQAPIRKLKALLDSRIIGDVFKARITFCSGFPVFDNQPFLATLNEFIITDIGSHVLDACRFLFGEAQTLYCRTASVNPAIQGEDVATVLLTMQSGMSCYVEMSYASILERESFPQTFVLIEGQHGSLHLGHDYTITATTRRGTEYLQAPPPLYPWLDPKYALVHASIVDCNRNILEALQGKSAAETTGKDNFETVRLVHACYASARSNNVIHLNLF